jgi:hypothetical protein
MRPISVDFAATEDRRRRLQKLAGDVFFRGNEFVCPHLDQCRGSRRPGDVFFEGTMSHVGKRFEFRQVLWLQRSSRIMAPGKDVPAS